MPLVQVLMTVEMPTVAGDPLDASHNTFVFEGGGTPHQVAAEAKGAIEQFYGGLHGAQTTEVGKYLGSQLSRAADAVIYRGYDISAHLNGSRHGSYIFLDTGTLNDPVAGTPLPEGCAAGLSFHSGYGSDVEFGAPGSGPHGGEARPRARDRGRIYLGPIHTGATEVDGTTHRVRLSPGFRTNLCLAAQGLRIFTGSTWASQWQVWSRVNAVVRAVEAGFCDDRIDYQRRREDQGLVRTLWDLVTP